MAEKTADQKLIEELKAENAKLKKDLEKKEETIGTFKEKFSEEPITVETLERYIRQAKWNPDKAIQVKDIIEIVDRIKYPDRWEI